MDTTSEQDSSHLREKILQYRNELSLCALALAVSIRDNVISLILECRFLDEMPQNDLQREGGPQKDVERTQTKGRQTLSALLDGLRG